MHTVLSSGKTSFNIEVPYKLIETGESGNKPLIIYLHGYNQNIAYLEKKVTPLLNVKAYHLLIQGPYPIFSRKRSVSEWGRAWYLYDGEQEQFLNSLELASEFIQQTVDGLRDVINANRICVIGYSMGGYLGGYFALSRWKLVNDLIVIGGRIKAEAFENKRAKAKQLNILALHGKKDTSVYPEPQQKVISELQQEGFNATFRLTEGNHKLSSTQLKEAKKWLLKTGYEE